jgi:hypothetical protein
MMNTTADIPESVLEEAMRITKARMLVVQASARSPLAQASA